MTTQTAARIARFFRAPVVKIEELTPSFRRFTLRGDDLADFGWSGPDQRIKVVFPTEALTLDDMPTGDAWWEEWRALPTDRQVPFRTYTTRAVRNNQCEVEIDMVFHEILGPASTWIAQAEVGQELLISSPTTAVEGAYGVDFLPPEHTDAYLLVGDETAAPAIAVILEQLPPNARGVVVAELPDAADAAYFPVHPGFEYRVGSREGRERHSFLVPAVEAAAQTLMIQGEGTDVTEIDIDHETLWEAPRRTAKGGAALKSTPLYAWLAGEAGAIKTLRRHLVSERGLDRRTVAFMGYWRIGKAEV